MRVVMDTSHNGIKHLVPARNESRLLVRVEVIPSNGCDVGGQHVKRGTHDVIIYTSELAEVQSLVRTEQAKADFDRALKVFARKLEDLCRGLGNSTEHQIERQRRIDEFHESPYSIMAEDPAYRGGFGKLLSCTVLEEVPAPPTVENLQATQFGKLGEVLAAAVGGGGGVPTPEQIDARVEALVAERLAALEERIAAAEARLRGLQESFTRPDVYLNADRVRDARAEEAAVKAELEGLEEEYLGRGE